MGRNTNPETQLKILNAALGVIRTQGYSATTVDELCKGAGVTKGAFFHYFDSKEDLAVAAADHWSEITGELFAHAPYHRHADPYDRLMGYLDFRKELLRGGVPEFTCLVGTMVQEAFDSSPAIRDACRRSIFGHAAEVRKFIEEAKKLRAPRASWSAESLALHTQAVLQGAFILAKANAGSGPKAKSSAEVAADSIDHLRRYIQLLFNSSAS